MRALATAAKAAPSADASFLVQRCSCNSPGHAADEMCEECREKQGLGLQPKLIVGAADDPYEREADSAARAVVEGGHASVAAGPVANVSRRATVSTGMRPAPASVARAIRGVGEPLGRAERAFYEPRFGHDFGSVRIHRDAAAAASARDIAALAYTVGSHVVLGSDSYAPASRKGRSLMAHELAHVVQQTGRVQRRSFSPLPEGHSNSATEDEELPQQAPSAEEEEEQGGLGGFVQRFPRGEMFGDEPGWDEKTEADVVRAEMKAAEECVKNTPPDPVECDPARALTWTDFAAAPDMSSRFGAVCHSGLDKGPFNTALLKCMPDTAAGQKANPQRIRAIFDGTKSWVKPRPKSPTNNAVNGCQAVIDKCKSDIAAGGPGTTWALNTGAPPGCAASPSPRGDSATSAAECDTVVGKDCADHAAGDSARLLRHENGHFNLSCAMARKANAMITRTTDVDKLLKAAKAVLKTQQSLYDGQTDHGCNAGPQATWETAITAGLPTVTITVAP